MSWASSQVQSCSCVEPWVCRMNLLGHSTSSGQASGIRIAQVSFSLNTETGSCCGPNLARDR
eukprot:12484751-Alexandrium_andersonii.AAC.1